MPRYWKTDSSPQTRPRVEWPSAGQAMAQLGLIVTVALVWGGILAATIRLTTPPVTPTAQAALPPSATAPPTSTPIPPTATSVPTDTPVPAIPATTATGGQSIATAPPTETPSPTATPVPTDTPPPPTETPASVGVSYAADIWPIVERRCLKCHGGEKTEEGFSMATYDDMLASSWNGINVVPGDVAGSYLIELIEAGDMPKKGPHLLPAEIRAFIEWIEAGAPNN